MKRPHWVICLVDDGSTDATPRVLSEIQTRYPNQVIVHSQPRNQGKAEAVREGMLRLRSERPELELLSYLDADLATSFEELERLAEHLESHPSLELVLGSRILYLGARISRQSWRHYVGRVFATAASLILDLEIYDTQCGAKVMRASLIPMLFGARFVTKWAFDVEMLLRFLNFHRTRPDAGPRIEQVAQELPLKQWLDVSGSKVRLGHSMRILWDLFRLLRYRVILEKNWRREPFQVSTPKASRSVPIACILGFLASLALLVTQRELSDLAWGIHSFLARPTALFLETARPFGLELVAIFSCYFFLLWRSRDAKSLSSVETRWILGVPVLIHLVYLFARPTFSTDVMSYLAQGYVSSGLKGNPYVLKLKDLALDDYTRALRSLGWDPWYHGVSPYGPMWNRVTQAVVALTRNVRVGIFALKSIAVMASLVSAALIWRILGKLQPSRQLFGTVLYLWCPMVLSEVALDGHNDSILYGATLLGLYLALERKPVRGVLALQLGVLCKFLPALFMPAHALVLWRETPDKRKWAASAALGLALCFVLAFVLYGNHWIGKASFGWSASTYAANPLIETVLGHFFQALFGLFFLYYTWNCKRREELPAAVAGISLCAVLMIAPKFLQWYYLAPFALLCLVPGRLALSMALLMSLHSRWVSPESQYGKMEIAVDRHSWSAPWDQRSFMPLAIAFLILVSLRWMWNRPIAIEQAPARAVDQPGSAEVEMKKAAC